MALPSLPEISNFKDWHIPWEKDQYTLKECLDNLALLGAPPDKIPLMVKLVENPKYRIPGVTLFHGAVELKQHDCIHALLGRGLLSKDEAFVIGFTMGSTNQVSTAEESMFCKIAKHLYPTIYRFNDEDIAIFKDAVRLASICKPKRLDNFEFEPWLNESLLDLRVAAGIDFNLIEAYYQLEKKRFPKDKASQRII
ncbi:MAG: hypothetical protein MI976_21185 [Pseudomonadales bacterium]|nr:hypothetical protein [Pseudomonadales bacterium]